ncbi:hypothetical protein ACWDTT_10420 [Streptosporangium sandarakinum]
MPRSIVRRSSAPAEDAETDYDDIEETEEQEEAPRRSRRDRAASARRHPAGRGRATADDDDEEDERPARRERSRASFAEGTREGRRPAGRRETERSRRPAPAGASRRERAAGSGWAAVKSKTRAGKFADNFKVPSDTDVVVKFLNNEPFAVYHQHWIPEAQGKKSYVCLEQDCPLCDIGDDARLQIAFNVISFANPRKPELLVWNTGSRLAQKLEGLDSNDKTGPIDREDLYWAVSKTGTGTATQYNLQAIKARDLEDWDVEALDEDELAEFDERKFDSSSVKEPSRETLEELVDEIS